MQSQVRKTHVRNNLEDFDELPPHAIGWCGEPIIYRKNNVQGSGRNYVFKPGHSHSLGEILVIGEYTYVIKDYKDGWWRLEWPD